ncbi:hypothetical protein [Candidatus Cardinium hertigii]|uniref:hypothetical protein n=1 Tax=Candidatus Cardinium hertigii TaxID=247481 RepID=UPI0013A52FEE|nr:hypothetical protein [Candidatus Cardinium hertigii]
MLALLFFTGRTTHEQENNRKGQPLPNYTAGFLKCKRLWHSFNLLHWFSYRFMVLLILKIEIDSNI